MRAESQKRKPAVGNEGATDGRAARSRATRARIVAAATGLFTDHGYTATSIGAIAAAAGVGEQTVYYAFKTKKAVLAVALDQAVAGDDQPVPTLERSWAKAVIDEPDPRRQLALQAAGAGDILGRAAPLLDVVRSAAPTDPDLKRLWHTNLEQRLTVQRTFTEALVRKTALRGGLTPSTAADLALATLSPETYTLLVTERHWPHEEWLAWAEHALASQLLPTGPAA
ncbi:TetR/AcrR family transcriptional regulator [Streptomyces roseicoloratus]|uniref:TetR/AcrR family transcriptional regulator n=1 Tax=Streptomyces roseicoloratus TaxID=2508722 RepID=A0ABY9RNR2_9ACTN|nr:TetR/AcrR family transcriptional regulator [Streptomyces roseicoloratus]WMX43825.1 TetR/AcrR family transcriptional regulator [Streptomyces roseicoloratus]